MSATVRLGSILPHFGCLWIIPVFLVSSLFLLAIRGRTADKILVVGKYTTSIAYQYNSMTPQLDVDETDFLISMALVFRLHHHVFAHHHTINTPTGHKFAAYHDHCLVPTCAP